MSDCCPSQQKPNQDLKRHCCPKNGKQYLEVPYRTVLHHVKNPWDLSLKEQRYYFCDDPRCEIVYFGLDNTFITQSMLRTIVGIKTTTDDALICYCFGITKTEARSNKQAKAFVVEQTKNGTCACEIRNPTGRCCLKDFPK